MHPNFNKILGYCNCLNDLAYWKRNKLQSHKRYKLWTGHMRFRRSVSYGNPQSCSPQLMWRSDQGKVRRASLKDLTHPAHSQPHSPWSLRASSRQLLIEDVVGEFEVVFGLGCCRLYEQRPTLFVHLLFPHLLALRCCFKPLLNVRIPPCLIVVGNLHSRETLTLFALSLHAATKKFLHRYQ